MKLVILLCQKITLMIMIYNYRSSRPEVFKVKGVLKIFSKFTGEHPWRSVFDVMRAIRSLFNDNNKYYSQLI